MAPREFLDKVVTFEVGIFLSWPSFALSATGLGFSDLSWLVVDPNGGLDREVCIYGGSLVA